MKFIFKRIEYYEKEGSPEELKKWASDMGIETVDDHWKDDRRSRLALFHDLESFIADLIEEGDFIELKYGLSIIHK